MVRKWKSEEQVKESGKMVGFKDVETNAIK